MEVLNELLAVHEGDAPILKGLNALALDLGDDHQQKAQVSRPMWANWPTAG